MFNYKCDKCGAPINADPIDERLCDCCRKEIHIQEMQRGYVGIGKEKGKYIPFDEAYTYALERCQSGTEEEVKEFREMLVEWYYSGNWIKTEQEV